MSDIHSRLRDAREKKGYKTPTDAARAMGVKPPTYLAHENGTTPPPRECICEDANQRPYGTGSASVRDLRARESVRTEGNCSGEPTTDTATISCRIESVYD